ncbi:transcriptional regulator Myc-B-like [Girardinichthys multiradiatus]|uniref:transcriptional regulator Myc-B-like n=1 Tax=Girardinichthys multiradiatus TaxID=208333 RepID=UPI001FABF11C|nr:transcriptional regulator Myc-B-like [Girardinichthys multiradiatus]
MAPMLATPSTDYDYDTIQPCFFLSGEEEDFYPPPHSQLLPGPGEDIWKKFELLPTPPLSPSRTPPQSDHSLSAADHLEAVSELLDEDSNPSAAFLQSFIIQDCMWSSSFGAATKLEKVVSERLASLRARRDSSDTCSLTGGGSDPQVGRCQVNAEYLQDLQAAASECIDPSVVFMYSPASEKQSEEDGATMEAGSELSLETPPLSSSDSESEEEEEDGEEEEIDVVTVDRQRTSRRSDALPLVLKRSHINIQQHNYAAPQPAEKRLKVAESPATAKQSGGRRCWSPRSDGEDEDRRRTHNVLERQRRNELRISFLALRDQIPAVANNDKAAKVVILKRATEFIREVGEDERRLLRKKDELTKRSRELKRRLEQLRTLH